MLIYRRNPTERSERNAVQPLRRALQTYADQRDRAVQILVEFHFKGHSVDRLGRVRRSLSSYHDHLLFFQTGLHKTSVFPLFYTQNPSDLVSEGFSFCLLFCFRLVTHFCGAPCCTGRSVTPCKAPERPQRRPWPPGCC